MRDGHEDDQNHRANIAAYQHPMNARRITGHPRGHGRAEHGGPTVQATRTGSNTSGGALII
jgi:hypothetical protein